MTDGFHREARRQQALLAALHDPAVPSGLRGPAAGIDRGLAAYRSNGRVHAQRALAAVCPTVQAMLGEAEFARLAARLWRDDPPTCGDLGEWGAGLPALIESIADLAEWPWLADSARLDLALHRCERAADAVIDRASFARLADHDPERLRLQPMPGLALVVSRHPIATLHAAHRDGSLDAARAAIEAGRAESACVVRQGWRAAVQRIDAEAAVFLAALLDGLPLGAALCRAGDAFAFDTWLADALRAGWLAGVVADEVPAGDRYSAPMPTDDQGTP